jgi:hypothetical protein
MADIVGPGNRVVMNDLHSSSMVSLSKSPKMKQHLSPLSTMSIGGTSALKLHTSTTY